jgi:hypothetical protein
MTGGDWKGREATETNGVLPEWQYVVSGVLAILAIIRSGVPTPIRLAINSHSLRQS